jgi:hypothetical protein
MSASVPIREIVPDHLLVEQKAKRVFADLLDKYGYKLIETVSEPNYVRLTYRNRLRLRKLVLENQTFPVDYGFGIYFYKLLSSDYQVVYNTPWEKQDKECVFLDKAVQKFSVSKKLIKVMKGECWSLRKDEVIQE